MLKFNLNPEHTKICPSCQEHLARLEKIAPLMEGAWNKAATENGVGLEDRLAILYAIQGKLVGQATKENRDVVKLQLTLSPIMGVNANEASGGEGDMHYPSVRSLPHIHD